jgi:hypothetical protein
VLDFLEGREDLREPERKHSVSQSYPALDPEAEAGQLIDVRIAEYEGRIVELERKMGLEKGAAVGTPGPATTAAIPTPLSAARIRSHQ